MIVDEMPSGQERQEWGQELRRARVAAGLEVADIARRLNLRTSFIQAVEDGHGDDFMEWSYERSHLRSMSSILGVTLTRWEVQG